MPRTEDSRAAATRAVVAAAEAIYTETRADGAFRRYVDVIAATLDRDDSAYMEAIRGLSRETLDVCARSLAAMFEHFVTEGRFEDVLGPAYMEIRSSWGRSRLGQYFTPWPVAVGMAQMAMADVVLDQRRSVNDPACGSGVMLLAARHAAVERWGRPALALLECYGQDIDHVCCQMARIQLKLSGAGALHPFVAAGLEARAAAKAAAGG